MNLTSHKRRGRKGTAPTQSSDAAAIPNPDHAWKTLALVNEWIRHSDAKAGVTLAFTGVLATMVFNLSKGIIHWTLLSEILVFAAGVLLLLTGALCGWTLTPRVRDTGSDPAVVNRLFFASISRNFTRESYGAVLSSLTTNPLELTKDLADQVHVNARIATTKAKWAKWAIRMSLSAAAAVAILATVIGTSH